MGAISHTGDVCRQIVSDCAVLIARAKGRCFGRSWKRRLARANDHIEAKPKKRSASPANASGRAIELLLNTSCFDLIDGEDRYYTAASKPPSLKD